MGELREVEKLCGRNCIRKYDQIYKLYDRLEGTILQEYMEQHNLD